MSLTQAIFEEIHLYLSGKMSSQEREVVENKINQDDFLAQEIKLQKRLKEGMSARAYKRRFQAIAAQLKTEEAIITPNHPLKTTWTYMTVAACIIIIVGLWLLLYAKKEPSITKEAVVSTHKVIPKEIVKSSPSSIQQVIPNKINLANYLKKPIGFSSPFTEGNTLGISPSSFAQWETDSTDLYTGVMLLTQQQHRKALVLFEHLEKSKFEGVQQQAHWYKTLLYALKKEENKAIISCKYVIADKQNPYHSKATQLLKELCK